MTRIYNLTSLPIFFDEAIFIFWAKRISEHLDGWFLPLSGGKNILLPWITVMWLEILPNSGYLAGGRLASVTAGAFTIIGIYKLSLLLFSSKRIGILAMIVGVFLPWMLFYDRLALYDSLLSAAILWSFYFCIKTAKSGKAIDSIFWGITLGLAHLAKATAIFFSILTPAAFLIYGFNSRNKISLTRRFFLVALSFIVSQLIANFFIFSSGFWEYQQKALDHSGGLFNPQQFIRNLHATMTWLGDFLTIPAVILSFGGLILLFVSKIKVALIFSMIIFLPTLVMAFFGREYFSRYLVFVCPFLAILIAYFLTNLLSRRALFLLMTSAMFYGFLVFDFKLWTRPETLDLNEKDKWQYISGFPSGYGLSHVFSFLKGKAHSGRPITFVIEGSYSHYPMAFQLEFWQYKNVRILERWPLNEIDKEILAENKQRETYLILRDDEKVQSKNKYKTLPVTVLFTAKKPGGADNIYVTKLK